MNRYFSGFMTNDTGGGAEAPNRSGVKEPPPMPKRPEPMRRKDGMSEQKADTVSRDMQNSENKSSTENNTPDTSDTQNTSDTSDPQANTLPYTGQGSVTVRAFLADQAIPLENVKITINSVDDAPVLINEILYTDRNGMTSEIYLPAPDAELSRRSENTTLPYAVYLITPELPGYYVNGDQIKTVVFDDIRSIQNIPMIPERERGV